MIVPDIIIQEQKNKQEERSMIIALALEIYPHFAAKAEFLDSAAKQSLRAARVFMEEVNKFEV